MSNKKEQPCSRKPTVRNAEAQCARGRSGTPSSIFLADELPKNFFSIGLAYLQAARACLTCGYLELYVNRADLAKITGK